MPVHHRFESEIIVLDLVGEYSMDELRTALLDSLEDPLRPGNPSLLINFSGSRSIYERSPEDVQTMANFIASQSKRFNRRIAFVAPDDLPFGLARMASVGSEQEGIEARVFRRLNDARAWLLS